MSVRQPKSNLITDRLHAVMVWLIGLIVAIVPLWVPTYIFIGTSFNKAILFYTLVTILVSMYLILIYRDKNYLPKFNIVGWSFVGLVATLGITTITSIQPYLSFWGAFSRNDGWITWFYYLIFFIIIASVVTTRQAWWRVISVSIVGTAAVVVYGLGQAVLWPGVVASLDRWRIESTLGNPVFLGGYLALALPFTLAWTFTKADRLWRSVGLMLIFLESIALTLTWSRGAWLGAIVGGLVFGIMYLYYFKRSWATRVMVGLIVGLGLLLGGLWMGQSLPEQSWQHRTSHYFLRTDSLMLRFQTWQIAQQAIYERPLLGWGLENFSAAFDQNYQVSRERDMSFAEAHNDRPHNEYLGMAINGGVVALLTYIMLLLSAIWLGYRQVIKSVHKQSNHAETIFYLGCLAAVVAYAVFALTAFQLVGIIPYFLLALAGLGQIFSTSPSARRLLHPVWVRPLSLIIGISLISLSYCLVIKPLIAVRLADQGTIVFQQQKFSESWQFFQKALVQKSYLSNPIRVQMLILADNQRQKSIGQLDFNDFQRQLVDLLPMNHKIEPYNSYHYLIFGIYYGHLAEVWPEYLSKSEASFQRVTELAPRKAETYWQWGNIYGQIGEIDKAQAKYDKALELEPSNAIINYQVGKWYLAVQGDLDRGCALIQKVLDNGFMPRFSDIKLVTQFLEEKGRLTQIELIYKTLIAHGQLYPNVDQVHAELLSFYLRHNINSPIEPIK
ncbi:MAG: O-antigen ligase family protein [Patescibacteria group bacterium]